MQTLSSRQTFAGAALATSLFAGLFTAADVTTAPPAEAHVSTCTTLAMGVAPMRGTRLIEGIGQGECPDPTSHNRGHQLTGDLQRKGWFGWTTIARNQTPERHWSVDLGVRPTAYCKPGTHKYRFVARHRMTGPHGDVRVQKVSPEREISC